MVISSSVAPGRASNRPDLPRPSPSLGVSRWSQPCMSASAFMTSVPRVTPPSRMIHLATRRFGDFRKRVDGAPAVIQLPSPMIRHVDHVDFMLYCQFGIFGRRHSLQDKR